MKDKNKTPKLEEMLPDDTLDLVYEEIDDYDANLEEYLEFCRMQYWQRRADGSLPWPLYDDENLEVDDHNN